MLKIVPTPDTSDDSTNWHGSLALTFARVGDATQIVHSRSQAPFKTQRSFYPEGAEVCHSVILHTAGGIVGGDRLSIDLRLQPQAQTLITTATASKLYRNNGQEASQAVNIHIGENACLEWLPQETIVFNQAIYQQKMHIELAPNALWLGWEVVRFGRTASGEQFIQGNWRSHTEVWQQGKPLWIDRQWLPGSEVTFHSPHGLAGCPVVGSFALVGRAIETETIEALRQLAAGNGEIGVTRLQSGLICRYRGSSTLEVKQWFMQVWQLLRQVYLNRKTCAPRVW